MPYWACARVQRERLALHCLGLAGYATYCPRLRPERPTRGKAPAPALFPNYVFIRIEIAWYSAQWCAGVSGFVRNGGFPLHVPDRIIDELRGRERGGLISLPRRLPYQPGERVRILEGPFRGHVGLYSDMPAKDRVAVLLQILGVAARTVLPASAVEVAS